MRMIAHSYDTYDHAVRAVNALEAAGVPHDDISLVSGDKDRSVATSVTGDRPENTGAVTGATTGTVLGGGAGLLAGLGLLAIPGVGPVVAAGWLVATLTGAGIGAATGGLLGSLTGAGIDEADAKTYAEHVGRGGTLVTVRAEDGMAAKVEDILEHGEVRAATTASVASAPVKAVAAAGASVAAAAADKIEVVKEDLSVGKRAVEQGSVKVTSHVVETPVQEEVRLRQERLSIDRRPINRPLTGVAADAFRDRTLSATAMSEQAVVSKNARVVEEIGLHKEATDRVETVRDTVRETKVDVEEAPGMFKTIGSAADVTRKPSPVRDNAATRAVDNTLGTNVSGENPSRKA